MLLRTFHGMAAVLMLAAVAGTPPATAQQKTKQQPDARESALPGTLQTGTQLSIKDISDLLTRMGFKGYPLKNNDVMTAYLITGHKKLSIEPFSVTLMDKGKVIWLRTILTKRRGTRPSSTAMIALLTKPIGKTRLKFYKDNIMLEQPIDNHGLSLKHLSGEVASFIVDARTAKKAWIAARDGKSE